MRLGENYQEARGVAEQINEEAIKVFGDMDATQFNKWLQENPDKLNLMELKKVLQE